MAEPISATGAIILGAAQLAGAGANAYAQGKQNKKTRKWNEKMYFQQLNDNLQNWHRQNEYNKPINQMNRLKEAGLNPMLMQGDGNLGMSTAAPSGADVKSWNPQAPQIDTSAITAPLNAVLTQRQIEQTGASAGNLKASSSLIYAQELHEKLKMAKTDEERNLIKSQIKNLSYQDDYLSKQSAYLVTQKALGDFNLQLQKDLRSNTIDISNLTIKEINSRIARTFSDISYNTAKTSEAYAGVKLAQALTKLNEHNADKVLAEIINLGKTGDNIDADTYNKRAQKFLTKAQTRIAEYQQELMQLDKDLKRAQTATEIQKVESMKARLTLDYAEFMKDLIFQSLQFSQE